MSSARGMRSSASRYSGKDSQSHWMPSESAEPGMSSTPSINWMSHSSRPGWTGANPTPQFPRRAVVTPCQHDGVRCGSHVAWPSKCVCTSTKPGVTRSPSASIVRVAAPSTRPTSTMTPSSTATSAVRGASPVPSTTVPPRITRSCIAGSRRQDARSGVNVAGSLAQPPMVPQFGYSTTAVSSMWKSGRRVRMAVIISANSMRARCDPTQRWRPTPKERWRLGFRSSTNRSASGNAAPSRPEEASLSRTRSPWRIGHPAKSTSSVTVRAWERAGG